MSVYIRPSPAIHAIVVVLATVVVLAIVGVPTKLSRLKRMTPAIHRFAAIFDIAIGVANVIAGRSASVGFCFPVESKHVLVLVLNFNKRSGCLLEIITNCHFSWVLFVSPPQYVLIVVSSSFFSGSLEVDVDCVEVVQKDAALEGPSMYLLGLSIFGFIFPSLRVVNPLFFTFLVASLAFQ